MKKYPKPYKKYIATLLDHLRREMFCGEYTMDIEYRESLGEKSDAIVSANITVDGTYLHCIIRVSDHCHQLYKDKKYKRLAEILTHEMCHLLTEPLYKIAINAITNTSGDFLEEIRERQTQRITNALFHRMPKDFYIPKINKKIKPSKAKRKT